MREFFERNGFAVVLLLSLVLYLPTIGFDFIDTDDRYYLLQNPEVVNPNLLAIFDPRNLTVSDWTPLVTISHVIEYQLGGFVPAIYHSTNILLHLLTVWVLYALLDKLGCTPICSLLIVAIYALHPLQVETVCWISARKDLLATLFGFLFLLSIARDGFTSAFCWLLLALGSKGSAVAFPLLAILITYSLHPFNKKRILFLSLFFTLALLRGLVSMVAQEEVVNQRPIGTAGVVSRVATMGPVFLSEIRQFLYPNDLSFMYFWEPMRWYSYSVLIAWSTLLAALLLLSRREAQIKLGVAALLISLLPVSNIVASPQFQADRYLHTAIAPAAFILVSLCYRYKYAPVIFITWILVVLVPFSVVRVSAWKNGETIWSDVIEQYPNYVFGWDMLSRYYLDRNQLKEAELSLRKVLFYQPGNLDGMFNLSLLLSRRGQHEEAKEIIEAGLIYNPTNPDLIRLKEKIAAQ